MSHSSRLSFAALFIVIWLLSLIAAGPVPRSGPDPDLVCSPATGWDILLFYLLNYVAHCATIKNFPGDKTRLTLIHAGLALFLPFSGIMRASASITRSYWPKPFSSPTGIDRAKRANALLVVGRTSGWEPRDGDHVDLVRALPRKSNKSEGSASIRIVSVTGSGVIDPTTFNIHGRVPEFLPDGYAYYQLPDDAVLETNTGGPGEEIHLTTSGTAIQSLIAIAQLIYAAITLYRSRGKQLERYGYASFGLTVIPYLTMSFVNFVAHVLVPDYPSQYIVHSDASDELERRGIRIDGFVGRLSQPTGSAMERVKFHRADSSNNAGADPKVFAFTMHSLEVKETQSSGGRPSHEGSQSPIDAEASEDLPTSEHFEERVSLSAHESQQAAAIEMNAMSKATIINVPYFLVQGDGKDESQGVLWLAIILALMAFIAPYLIIWGLTRFQNGTESSEAQRGWTMAWLVIGEFYGYCFGVMDIAEDKDWGTYGTIMSGSILCAVPAIGGLVVVGQMILQYGSCVLTD